MAKKAATTDSKSQPAPKPASAKAAAAPKSKSAGAPALTSTQIGAAAGQVWQALSKNGGLTLAELKKSVSQPADVVVAALGWLAREDKLKFDASGKSAKVSLK